MIKKILFNCTTNTIGGGVKNSAIFIKYALEDKNNKYYFAISPQVKDILDKWDIIVGNIYLFEKSPARNIKERVRLYNLANKLDINLVFTMAGPAYVDFEQTHVMGISNPYVSHVDYEGLSIGKTALQTFRDILLTIYQSFYARKSDFFIFQTESSRNGFCKRLFIDKTNTKIITNAIGCEFLDFFKQGKYKKPDKTKTIKILCPAAGYKHKALHLIPSIAKEIELLNKNYKAVFILTIDYNSCYWKEIENLSKKLNVINLIKTIGSFNYSDALKIYLESDFIFVPSILETFSASYLEAFASKKPLIVAKKDFSKDICKESAIYIDPFDSYASAKIINNLINNDNLQKKLLVESKEILNSYGDQKNRFNEINKYLTEIMIKNNMS